MLWHHSRFEAPSTSILYLQHKWGDHFHPMLNFLGPLLWIWPSPLALLFLQSLGLGLSVPAVYRFSARRLGPSPALFWTLIYALYPGIQTALLYDFHDIVLALPLIAWALVFLDEDRLEAYGACLLLMLLVRENLALLSFVLALGLFWKGRPKLACALAAFSLVWFYLAVLWIIPHYRPEGGGYNYWTYQALGSGPVQALLGLVKKPCLLFTLALDQPDKVSTLRQLFAPFLFLPLFSPWTLLALPLLAERFWSSNPVLWAMGFHYSALIAPFLALAGASALAKVSSWPLWNKRGARVRTALVCLSLVLCALKQRDLPLRFLLKPGFWKLSHSDQLGREALALIPPDATVAAQEKILAHLSLRAGAFVLDGREPPTDYIVASKSVNPEPFADFRPYADILTKRLAEGYKVIYQEGGWIVLKAGDRTNTESEHSKR